MTVQMARNAMMLTFCFSACANITSTAKQTPRQISNQDLLPTSEIELRMLTRRDAAQGPGGSHLDRAVHATEKLIQMASKDAEARWQAARAIFYLVLAQPERLDERLTQRCLEHSRKALDLHPSAPAHLYHALCLGIRAQFAPTEGLGLVKKMQTHAKRVQELDSKFDHAAGARLLGGIYMKAPAWPASIGDIEAAIEHLEEAVRLDPAWPENALLLAEAYYEEDRSEEAQATLQEARRLTKNLKMTGWQSYFNTRIKIVEDEFRD